MGLLLCLPRQGSQLSSLFRAICKESGIVYLKHIEDRVSPKGGGLRKEEHRVVTQ